MNDETLKHILIVEDEIVIALLIEEIVMKTNNVKCVIVTNGKKAINAIIKSSFDLIIMDLNLGGGNDGVQIMQEAREQGVNTPFIVVSGNSEEATVKKVLDVEPEGYLIKPVNSLELSIMINLFFKKIKNKAIATAEKYSLTFREVEILDLLVNGGSNKSISAFLFISESTVSTHRMSILKKMNCRNTADLVRKSLS
jgi:DNA-binding NarL/FixJ family response regulator